MRLRWSVTGVLVMIVVIVGLAIPLTSRAAINVGNCRNVLASYGSQDGNLDSNGDGKVNWMDCLTPTAGELSEQELITQITSLNQQLTQLASQYANCTTSQGCNKAELLAQMQNAAGQRKTKLMALAPLAPGQTYSLFFTDSQLAKFPTDINLATSLEKKLEGQGVVSVTTTDDTIKKISTTIYTLTINNTSYRLYAANGLPQFSGQPVEFQGKAIENVLVTNPNGGLIPRLGGQGVGSNGGVTVGNRKILALFVTFSGDTGTPALTAAQITEDMVKVKNFYTEVSYGKLNLQTTVKSGYKNIGTKPAAINPPNCDGLGADAIVRQAIPAFDAEINFMEYNSGSIIVFAPTIIGCSQRGSLGSATPFTSNDGNFTAGAVFFNNRNPGELESDVSLRRNQIAHELGHNLGLGHANKAGCINDVLGGPGRCPANMGGVYGDRWDNMNAVNCAGIGCGPVGHFSSFYKWQLNWLDGNSLISLGPTTTAILELIPLEVQTVQTEGWKSLFITFDNNTPNDANDDWAYVLDYRVKSHGLIDNTLDTGGVEKALHIKLGTMTSYLSSNSQLYKIMTHPGESITTFNGGAGYEAVNIKLCSLDSGKAVVAINQECDWIQGTSAAVNKMAHDAVAYQNKMYVWGGFTEDSETPEGLGLGNTKMYVYDPAKEGTAQSPWTVGAAKGGLSARGIATALVNDKIYSWQGIDANGDTDLNIYNISNNSWSKGTRRPVRRYDHKAGVVNGKIYYWGGITNPTLGVTYFDNSVDIYDPAKEGTSSGPWSQGTAGGTKRHYHTATVYNNKIYYWGGTSESGGYLTSVDVYDPAKEGTAQSPWTVNYSIGGKNRGTHTAVLVGSKIYFYGGRPSESLDTSVDVFDIPTKTWTNIAGNGPQRSWHSSVFVGGRIIHFGGRSDVPGENYAPLGDVLIQTASSNLVPTTTPGPLLTPPQEPTPTGPAATPTPIRPTSTPLLTPPQEPTPIGGWPTATPTSKQPTPTLPIYPPQEPTPTNWPT